MLLHAFVWRRLLAATTRERPQPRARLDAVPPPTLDPRRAAACRAPADRGARIAGEDRAAPSWRSPTSAPRAGQPADPDDRPRSTSSAATSPSSTSLAGWPSGASGSRIVTVDPTAAAAALVGGAARVLQRARRPARPGRGRVRTRGGRRLEVSRADRFVATTWWTAHIAASSARDRSGGERFLYLIQEYEPFTFPMGSYAALASRVLPASRTTPCSRPSCCATTSAVTASVSSPTDVAAGDRSSVAFQNAITAVEPPALGELRTPWHAGGCSSTPAPSRTPPATCSSWACWRSAGRSRTASFEGGWSCTGSARVDPGGAIDLGGGSCLELLPRSGPAALRRAAPRARRRPRADVHAAPEPGPDRDGLAPGC